MTDAQTILFILAAVWIGWPLWSIADHLGALRRLATRGRR